MNNGFLQALTKSYLNYLLYGERSNKKLIPIHQFISNSLIENLDNDFKVYSLNQNEALSKELKITGKYYNKNVDIVVCYKNKPISGIGFKFITSNYKQNANNYFENMLGENANLRRNGFIYAQIIVLKFNMPYYSSNKKAYTHIETINDNDIMKYYNLYKDRAACLYHKPDLMLMKFIKTGDEIYINNNINIQINKKVFFQNILNNININVTDVETNLLKQSFSNEIFEFLTKISNFTAFIEAFVNLTKSRIYGI